MSYDITNRCNFRCLHCFNRSGENEIMKDELSDDEARAFIADAADRRPTNLCICGGEPLLRYELLLDCLRVLKANNTRASMVTNGYLLTRDKALALKEAGLVGTQVSVDGATAATHERVRGKKGSFERALAAVEHFANAGFTDISVAFSPTSFNVEEFGDVERIVRDRGCTNVRLQPLMPLGRSFADLDILPTPQQYRRLVAEVRRIDRNGDHRVDYGDPVEHLIAFRSIVMDCVTFVGVAANGGIEPSPYLPIVVGNVRRHKFSEYWDAGLARVWKDERVRAMAENISSIPDMGRKQEGRRVWWDQPLEFDFIDDQRKEH